MTQELLTVENLSLEVQGPHGNVTLIDDVSFSVGAGEVVGLVGESGSGKTVTSLSVMQLLPHNSQLSGSVRLDGKELTTMSRRELGKVRGVELSMIFQEPRRSLNPAFTVGDQIAESVRQHQGASRKEAWARAVDLMDLVEIDDPSQRAHQYPHELSGGMCQRVMIAMALACDPKMLIADEPTTALDATVQKQVLELILRIQEASGIGVLLITHDLGVVAEVCDRAIVMYAGRIVESGPVLDLFDNPQHPYTAGLIHSMPDVVRHEKKMGAIPGVVPQPDQFISACRFAARCPYAAPECLDGFVPLQPTPRGGQVRCIRSGTLDLSEAFYD
ncbi:ABC transporter ATP-binding protein [Pseudarthrobacter sulfonivorans]|uniref:ABC transporter ATP-binding protein n=1 Tax=Pseudarthrobacter sulfonivorans TaxID=121292 RepID=UPI001CC2991C|nr:ABC transporter ATP-binding protein [Pseudarthrobacter sulfonivorans]